MKPHLHIALALIWREGQLLLSRRRSDADHLPDLWEFPGGKIEAGEKPEAAAIREAREEVGLEVEVVAARELIEWEYEKRFVTLYPFDCSVVGGSIEAREVAEWKWVAPCELNSTDFPPANAWLIEQIQSQH